MQMMYADTKRCIFERSNVLERTSSSFLLCVIASFHSTSSSSELGLSPHTWQFWFWVLGFWVLGFGFWVLGFGVWGLGFGVWGLGLGAWGWGLCARVFHSTGVPRPQETAPPYDPTLGLCLGSQERPRGVAFSYERGTPVEQNAVKHY